MDKRSFGDQDPSGRHFHAVFRTDKDRSRNALRAFFRCSLDGKTDEKAGRQVKDIKFQSLNKLAETASDHLYEALINRLQDYASNLQELGRKVVSEQDDRART